MTERSDNLWSNSYAVLPPAGISNELKYIMLTVVSWNILHIAHECCRGKKCNDKNDFISGSSFLLSSFFPFFLTKHKHFYSGISSCVTTTIFPTRKKSQNINFYFHFTFLFFRMKNCLLILAFSDFPLCLVSSHGH